MCYILYIDTSFVGLKYWGKNGENVSSFGKNQIFLTEIQNKTYLYFLI